MKPAIFLDRDGVINQNPPNYVKSWDEFRFLPGAIEALRMLAGLPWPVLIATNQSAVGRGILRLEELERIHSKMRASIQSSGGRIDGIYVCPHKPEENCDCRKPRPGLLLRAALEHQIDLTQSIMVGDSRSDVEAAQAVFMPAILIRSSQLEEPNDFGWSGHSNNSIMTAESLYEIVEVLNNTHGSLSGKVYPAELMVYFPGQRRPRPDGTHFAEGPRR